MRGAGCAVRGADFNGLKNDEGRIKESTRREPQGLTTGSNDKAILQS